jgi:hypothetical protein
LSAPVLGLSDDWFADEREKQRLDEERAKRKLFVDEHRGDIDILLDARKQLLDINVKRRNLMRLRDSVRPKLMAALMQRKIGDLNLGDVSVKLTVRTTTSRPAFLNKVFLWITICWYFFVCNHMTKAQAKMETRRLMYFIMRTANMTTTTSEPRLVMTGSSAMPAKAEKRGRMPVPTSHE